MSEDQGIEKKVYVNLFGEEYGRDEVFSYLENLRDSGRTNMFGAGAYLEARFGFDKKAARAALSAWMESFGNES